MAMAQLTVENFVSRIKEMDERERKKLRVLETRFIFIVEKWPNVDILM